MAKQFGKAASVYDAHAHLQARISQQLWSLCAESISGTPSLILDAGCGTAQLWAKNNANVVGIDSAFEMCKQAQARIIGVNATIESLPFADECFDLVFSSYAMQWAQSLEVAMAECYRVLKRGGVFALAVPVEGTLHELHESFEHTGLASHVMHFRTSQTYESLIDKNQIFNRCVEKETLHYDSPLALMRVIKQIGAGAVTAPSRKGLMTSRQLKQIDHYYRMHYNEDGKIVASWNTLMLVVRKT